MNKLFKCHIVIRLSILIMAAVLMYSFKALPVMASEMGIPSDDVSGQYSPYNPDEENSENGENGEIGENGESGECCNGDCQPYEYVEDEPCGCECCTEDDDCGCRHGDMCTCCHGGSCNGDCGMRCDCGKKKTEEVEKEPVKESKQEEAEQEEAEQEEAEQEEAEPVKEPEQEKDNTVKEEKETEKEPQKENEEEPNTDEKEQENIPEIKVNPTDTPIVENEPSSSSSSSPSVEVKDTTELTVPIATIALQPVAATDTAAVGTGAGGTSRTVARGGAATKGVLGVRADSGDTEKESGNVTTDKTTTDDKGDTTQKVDTAKSDDTSVKEVKDSAESKSTSDDSNKSAKLADPETPLADKPFEEGPNLNFLWLLGIAAACVAGVAGYLNHKRKVAANDEAKKYKK